MSAIIGGDALIAKFDRLPTELQVEMQAAFEANAKQLQVEAVAFVPVASGNLRDLLASPEALLVERRPFGPYMQFGFRTRRLQKEGYYAPWVEQGTKAHTRGEAANPGTDKRSASGRRRPGRRKKRSSPARPAQPFMRPAFDRFRERLERARGEILKRAAERVGLIVRLGF